MIGLNADLLLKRNTDPKEPYFNGPLLLVLIALATVTTFFLYFKSACSDPGFVRA
jgi:hypothetical protein